MEIGSKFDVLKVKYAPQFLNDRHKGTKDSVGAAPCGRPYGGLCACIFYCAVTTG